MLSRLVTIVCAFALVGGLAWANWPEQSLDPTLKADRVVVHKAQRELQLLNGGRVLKSYRVSLGRNPLGHKQREGDARTPEGDYVLDWRNERSGYHRALHVSYPSARDTAQARARGDSPGGDIMVHGIRNRLGWIGRFHRLADWTAGCIAVTNSEIEEIWQAVPDGTPISIFP